MSKILIVEDEESIAELEKDYLELSGFEVEIENNGTDGLERALKEEYDLLILDLMLPGTDGFEICRRVREVKNTPIIMVSAKKEDIDKIRGLGLGADDYITKPFSPSEMVARVKAHMARYERLVGSGQPANEIIEIRGLKIDKTARRVWVNGEEKTFTTKEFDLLSFLAQNPNHVFTKEELFSKIWDMESIGDIATVTVHIKKIRSSLIQQSLSILRLSGEWGIGLRYNESKRKTSAAKSGICFSWTINKRSVCVSRRNFFLSRHIKEASGARINAFVYNAHSQIRTNNGYVKMTESGSAYTGFYSKINKFFQSFASKRVY